MDETGCKACLNQNNHVMQTQLSMAQIKVNHFKAMIKQKQAQLAKFARSVADSLSEKQICIFGSLNKTVSLFDDTASRSEKCQDIRAEIIGLKADLLHAQERYDFFYDTQNMVSLQLN